MASNAFANAAAAVSGGYIKTNTDRGVAPTGAGNAPVYPASERFQTTFSKIVAGAVGEPGIEIVQSGFGVDQNTAELNALANQNAYRADRYGSDSTAASAAITDRTGLPAASATKKHTKDVT
jgi:hypothetical protein